MHWGLRLETTQETPDFVPPVNKNGIPAVDDDKLSRSYDTIFNSVGLVPVQDTTADKDAKPYLAKSRFDDDHEKAQSRPQNQSLGVLYGIKTKAFRRLTEETKINQQLRYLTEVVIGVLRAFFIWEWKSCQGSMEMAQNQACRGGAALVERSKAAPCSGKG
ncbi:hypothetical protein MMC06_000991 [Schaereria dolodes]|nr:hypothetical protein [Schaereria dolodes]